MNSIYVIQVNGEILKAQFTDYRQAVDRFLAEATYQKDFSDGFTPVTIRLVVDTGERMSVLDTITINAPEPVGKW